MRQLLRAVSWMVRWATRTPRRVIGVLASRCSSPSHSRPGRSGTARRRPRRRTCSPARRARRTGAGADRPAGDGAARHAGPATLAAAGAVVPAHPGQAGSRGRLRHRRQQHDARPGGDKSFTDSYARTRPYLTDALYREVTAGSRRGDYEWAQWLAGKATVGVQVLKAGVPDGAPAPTATTAYVRVEFRQTVRPTAGAGGPTRRPTR